MKRREFIPALGLGGSFLIAGTRGFATMRAGDSPQRANGETGRRPKLSSVSWNFHSLAPGHNPEEAIDIIGSLGFDGVELIANSKRDVDEYWTDTTIDRIRKKLDQNRLVVPQFPMFQPVVEGLTSRNRDERNKNLDYFEA